MGSKRDLYSRKFSEKSIKSIKMQLMQKYLLIFYLLIFYISCILIVGIFFSKKNFFNRSFLGPTVKYPLNDSNFKQLNWIHRQEGLNIPCIRIRVDRCKCKQRARSSSRTNMTIDSRKTSGRYLPKTGRGIAEDVSRDPFNGAE